MTTATVKLFIFRLREYTMLVEVRIGFPQPTNGLRSLHRRFGRQNKQKLGRNGIVLSSWCIFLLQLTTNRPDIE